MLSGEYFLLPALYLIYFRSIKKCSLYVVQPFQDFPSLKRLQQNFNDWETAAMPQEKIVMQQTTASVGFLRSNSDDLNLLQCQYRCVEVQLLTVIIFF